MTGVATMKLGILSDTHNEIGRTRAALEQFKARGIDTLIHCGDVTQPKIVKLFEGWHVAFVYGNIDREKSALARTVAGTSGPYHIGVAYEDVLDSVRLGVCHGHDGELLDAMIESGEYDLVCHGHFHRQRDEWVHGTRVISPGALGGTFREPRSICVFDLITKTAEFLHVG